MSEQASLSLSQWLTKIEAGTGDSIHLGLERIQRVAERLALLPLPFPCVVVGGTNGKGSTVATLVWLLTQAGQRVGSYTSPHLTHFEERIQVEGQPIKAAALISAFEAIAGVSSDVPLTYFEWITLAALWSFKQASPALDLCVLEVGLGGRLDAVNIVNPMIAVVSSIGHDHQAFLGNTLEAIAAEKAGIFRADIPVVLGKSVTQQSLLSQAKTFRNTVWQEGKDFDSLGAQSWQCQGHKITVPNHALPPSSVSLACATYTILEKQLGSLPPLATVIGTLAEKSMTGRFDAFKYQGKTIICDVAHNAEGAAWLAKRLSENGVTEVIAVWASLQDKAMFDIVQALQSKIKFWCIGELAVERAASVTQMQDVLTQFEGAQVQSYTNMMAAFQAACAMAQTTVLVFGSFYTVSDILSGLGRVCEPLSFHGLKQAKNASQRSYEELMHE